MNAHQRGVLARLLWDRRAELLRAVAETEEDLRRLDEDREFESVERGQEVRDARLLALLSERDRREIDEIFAAIGRLQAGTYGICEDCAQSIPFDRLRVLPGTRWCADCARTRERQSVEERG